MGLLASRFLHLDNFHTSPHPHVSRTAGVWNNKAVGSPEASLLLLSALVSLRKENRDALGLQKRYSVHRFYYIWKVSCSLARGVSVNLFATFSKIKVSNATGF